MPTPILRLIPLLLAVAVGCGAPPGRPAGSGDDAADDGEARIAVVDLERVLAETDRGQEAMEEFARLGQGLQEHLDELREALREMEANIEAAQEREAPEEEMAELLSAYQRAAAEAQREFSTSQQRLEAYRAQLTGPLLEDVARIVRRIGRAEGYDLIVDRGGLAWVEPTADLTPRVIEVYREEEGSLGPRRAPPRGVLGEDAEDEGEDSEEDGASGAVLGE